MNDSLIYCGEPERPPVPQTSFQQQYQRLDATDDARPLGAAYSDIAAEIACLEKNTKANQGSRYRYDQAAAER